MECRKRSTYDEKTLLDRPELERAIAWFEEAVRETDEILDKCSQELQEELIEQKGHFITGLIACGKIIAMQDATAALANSISARLNDKDRRITDENT
jgi:hypothetical protein